MRKITTLFAVLFIALSANAQLVVEKNSNLSFWPYYYNILSFNGPVLPPITHIGGSNTMFSTTWHGRGHAWISSPQGSVCVDPLDIYSNPTRFEMILFNQSVQLGTNKGHIYFTSIDRDINWEHYNTVNAGDFISWGGNYYTVSDISAKTNIMPVSGALSTILALKPVTYKWINQSTKFKVARVAANPKEIGFIAQDVEKVIPDIVAVHDDKQIVNYQALIPILTAAIQELNERIVALENQIKAK